MASAFVPEVGTVNAKASPKTSTRHIPIPLSSFPPGSHPACGTDGSACQCSRQTGRCLILVMLTQPYLPMYVNWLHAIAKISPDMDVLVLSEDRESCQWLHTSGLQPGVTHVLRPRRWKGVARQLEDGPSGNTTISAECASNATLPPNSSAYGSPGFAMLARRRAGHIRRAVRHRCCVIWSDLDAVWLRDPSRYLGNAPERCNFLAPQHKCTSGEGDRCFDSAFSAFFWDEHNSVPMLMRRWASLLPKVGPRAAKKPKISIGRMASFDDAVADQHRGACALPESHFPDSRTLSWTDGQLGASAATSQSDSPFIVHADFAGIPQKVRHLRSSGLWKKGSRREVARVSGTPL